MKLIIVAAALLAVVSAGRLEHTYLPPSNAGSAPGSNFLSAPSRGVSQRLSGSYSTGSAQIIPIVRLDSDNTGDGNYRFSYETANRITAEESGLSGDLTSAKGSYSYVGDDGQTYTVNYIADENGFQAQGAHLPTPPPVPQEILKALAENAADEARGIVDDGQYRPQAGEDDGQYSASSSRFGSQSITPPKQGGYRY